MISEGLIIDAISDTHNKHESLILPGGHVLIHAGDATGLGTLKEIVPFLDWLSKQNYKYKIFVPGNHDWGFQDDPSLMLEECTARGIILLNDSGIEIEGIKFWGSPVQPEFGHWAFNRNSIEIADHWALIPEDTEVLITHGPPHQILDYVPALYGELRYCGCPQLLSRIYQTKTKLHVFGHIHYARGYRYYDGRTYVNASVLNEAYRPYPDAPKRILREITGDYVVQETILE